jgi:hypothetical protein
MTEYGECSKKGKFKKMSGVESTWRKSKKNRKSRDLKVVGMKRFRI